VIAAIALVVFATVTVGVYLALSRDLFRVVLGLAMVGSAANLLLFAAGRLGPTAPAVVPVGETALAGAANPLPQALVLTAIVIGFALVCFSLVLMLRLIRDAGTDDALALRDAEPEPTDPVKPPLPDPAFEPTVAEPARTVQAPR
jgi:multicomponent Na+:H+ antiporter subunit C